MTNSLMDEDCFLMISSSLDLPITDETKSTVLEYFLTLELLKGYTTPLYLELFLDDIIPFYVL